MKSRRSLVIVALFGILAIVASALAERRPWRGEVALPGVEQVASAETEAAEAPSRPAYSSVISTVLMPFSSSLRQFIIRSVSGLPNPSSVTMAPSAPSICTSLAA